MYVSINTEYIGIVQDSQIRIQDDLLPGKHPSLSLRLQPSGPSSSPWLYRLLLLKGMEQVRNVFAEVFPYLSRPKSLILNIAEELIN